MQVSRKYKHLILNKNNEVKFIVTCKIIIVISVAAVHTPSRSIIQNIFNIYIFLSQQNNQCNRFWWKCHRINTYSGRTKYSAFVSKLNKLSEEYLSPQKTQKAAGFFIGKILGRRLIWNLHKSKQLKYFCLNSIWIGI